MRAGAGVQLQRVLKTAASGHPANHKIILDSHPGWEFPVFLMFLGIFYNIRPILQLPCPCHLMSGKLVGTWQRVVDVSWWGLDSNEFLFYLHLNFTEKSENAVGVVTVSNFSQIISTIEEFEYQR